MFVFDVIINNLCLSKSRPPYITLLHTLDVLICQFGSKKKKLDFESKSNFFFFSLVDTGINFEEQTEIRTSFLPFCFCHLLSSHLVISH
jgi:hypothetical protein